MPEPPLSPKGRQRYWDETVFEAVAELRKRLRSQDSEVALEALEMILDLEKTRIRHAAKVSGTHVPNLSDLEDDWGNPLLPTSRDREGAGEGEKTSPPAPLSAGRGTGGEVFQIPTPPRIPGVTACFSDRGDYPSDTRSYPTDHPDYIPPPPRRPRAGGSPANSVP